MDLAAELERVRTERRLSYEAAAAELGCSGAAFHNWCHGQVPQMRWAAVIADWLGVPRIDVIAPISEHEQAVSSARWERANRDGEADRLLPLLMDTISELSERLAVLENTVARLSRSRRAPD